LAQISYHRVGDVCVFLEYVMHIKETSMHSNPTLLFYGKMLYQFLYDISVLFKHQVFEEADYPAFYQREGEVHADEFSYYVRAVKRRYQVCK
jgi:hypothetical protein